MNRLDSASRIVGTLAALLVFSTSGCATQGADAGAVIDRPDLSGTYDTATITPLQRPEAYGDKLVLTAAEAKAIDDLLVFLLVTLLDVVEQLAALVDQTHQALAGMVIFLVLTEVLGEFCNSL